MKRLKRLWRWMWFDCARHGPVWHRGKGRCPICEVYGFPHMPKAGSLPSRDENDG